MYLWNGIYFQKNVKKLVIKIGTSCVINENGQYDFETARRLVKQICDIKSKGISIVLVVSGAVALANSQHNSKRILAAKGSHVLFQNYSKLFHDENFETFTALLHEDDLVDQELQNSLDYLAAADKTICIINENDFAKKNLTNNDLLAAEIANAINADCLVLLSTVDGLLDQKGSCIRMVRSLDFANGFVEHHKSKNGTGGMKTKIQAFENCKCKFGIIANGKKSNILNDVLSGKQICSLFVLNEGEHD